MKSCKKWMFMTAALLLVLVAANVDAVAPFKKVSIATTSKTTSTTATPANSSSKADAEETAEGDAQPEAKEEKSDNSTSTKDSRLTGIPQIDYIWDPNLPRELRGYNLSSYPFLSTTPTDDDIHFKCDGLHDGFYASIEYKCQLYHHCVYGIRHDFLCANFTAFDQRTFICHFVSDVDCEGSQKYWNRNDDLYMATTTTSTTTTTTEPPPTQRRRPVRPLRPLRRPSNRRPIDDYYYEDEEYDEEYYEERVNRRRKQRPRHRKPVVAEYEDDYEEEKRSFADEKPRRNNNRDRVRDEIEPEDDYDTERRSFDKPKSRNKPTATAERRKISSRKPSTFSGRANADERRSLSDDRPLTGRRKGAVEEPIEPVETPRRPNGRRRLNEKRSTTASPSSDLDDLDEYVKPHAHIPDQEEAAADEDVPPKIKTTPKPLEEFITPKAAPSSVYARPRAPPRIARPVPVSAKGKFQYPVQRTATTSAPPAGSNANEDEDYYDEEYDDARGHRVHNKKRIVDEVVDEEEEIPAKRGKLPRKPTRTLRKPTIEKKVVATDVEEDYETDDRYTRRGTSRRKNPLTGRQRNRTPLRDDVDFVDDDYEERPIKRPRPGLRKSNKKPKIPEPSEEIDAEDVEPEIEHKPPARARGGGLIASRRKTIPSIPSRSRSPAAQAVSLVNDEEIDSDVSEDLEDSPAASNKNSLPTSRPASVRVVKRPFLPSRGGSPYLPRGLQPVGIAHKSHDSHTTDSSLMDMFSTNSGVHLLEHGAPLLRDSGPRTTLPPRSALPVSQPRPDPQPSSKATLDELYENDYDVTLNDALNPTLKPLSPHQSNLYHQHHENNNNNRPYQNQNYYSSSPISSASYSSASTSSSPKSPFSSSDSFVYKNQSPSSSTSSSFEHSSSFQTQTQPKLTQPQNYHQIQQQPDHPTSQHQYQENSQLQSTNFNSDSYFSSTDIRRRTIASPQVPQTSRSDNHRTNTNIGSRIAPVQEYYDDYEY